VTLVHGTQSTPGLITLNASTAVALNPVVATPGPVAIENQIAYSWTNCTLTVTNTDVSATVYLGGSSSVSSTSYGYKLLPGISLGLDGLTPTEILYAISSGASNVSVLAIYR